MTNWKCKACAASLAGICALHALKPSDEQPQLILFYQQDEGHPEPERTPEPQRQIRAIALNSTSAISSVTSGNPFISGDTLGNFTLTWTNPNGETVVVDGTRPFEVTSKST